VAVVVRVGTLECSNEASFSMALRNLVCRLTVVDEKHAIQKMKGMWNLEFERREAGQLGQGFGPQRQHQVYLGQEIGMERELATPVLVGW
jgi:hypothetical protein